MEKKEMQDKVKSTLQGAAGSIKNAAQNIKKPELKLPKVKYSSKRNGVRGEKEESEETAVDEGENTAVQNDSTNTTTKDVELVAKPVSCKNGIKIFYYLMAADGVVSEIEKNKLDEIGEQIDPKYSEIKDSILAECENQLKKIIDPEDYYDVVQDGVEEAILIPDTTADNYIPSKLLVWNLLTIAYSDENYDEKERKLMKYIVRKLRVDSTVFLEMEYSLQTLMDIEKELNWIKKTDKPYLTIETQVKELENRKEIIFESVKDLIVL